jgi:uncharacterized membrane protein YvlD (DUF360 family)
MSAIRRLVAFYGLQVELIRKWRPGRRALIRRALISFVVSLISLAATIRLLPGMQATDPGAVIVAVIVLALLNMLIRPLILGVLAPLSVILVAIATLVWQVGSFLLLDPLVAGVSVASVWTALIGSFVYAIVNTFLTALLSIDQDDSYYGTLVRQLASRREGVIRTDRPGVLIVQIDGLAHPILTHQIRAGRVPIISGWVRSKRMRLDRWIALLPSQTSASQAGILHGNNSFIPAFRWWEKSRTIRKTRRRSSGGPPTAKACSRTTGPASATSSRVTRPAATSRWRRSRTSHRASVRASRSSRSSPARTATSTRSS